MSHPLRPDDRPALDPDMLIKVYAMGIFPMADDRDADEIYWVEPKSRGIMPLDATPDQEAAELKQQEQALSQTLESIRRRLQQFERRDSEKT